MTTHAIVLIEAERTALSTLGAVLAGVEGVAEAYSVTGEWDFVVCSSGFPATTCLPTSSPATSGS